MERFTSGMPVALRSVRGGVVFTVRAMTVIQDDDGLIALYLPAGATVMRPRGQRGGPGGRLMLSRQSGHEEGQWTTNRTLVLHRPGEAHTTDVFWDDASGSFVGWYVNLQAPWTRTPIGFDTCDHVLDITVAPGLERWRWKDEDELANCVERGIFTYDEAKGIRAEG